MPERVDEATLPVHTPGHLVVADLVDGAVRSRGDGSLDERVRVVDEDLDAYGPGTQGRRSVPAVALRLAEEERCAFDGETYDAAEVPQFDGAQRSGVPPCG